jgi:hypothetical protein
MFKLFSNFLAADTLAGSAGGGAPAGMGKEDTIKFLGDDDGNPEVIDLDGDDDAETGKGDKTKDDKTKSSPKDKSKSKEKADEDTDDDSEEDELADTTVEDEIDEDLEPSDEKLELVTPVRRKEILKKYPQLFKDFPYLQTAYYREQKFTEICGTIEDAKDMHSKAETLDAFEADLMKGNTERTLTAIKETSPKMFQKAVDNYLGVLQKVDNGAYLHVLGNVMKHTIAGMVSEGRRTKNEALEGAAALLNQYCFASSEYTPPSNLFDGKEESTEESDLDKQRREFRQEKFNDAKSTLDERINKIIKNTIEASVDPRQSMSDYIRRNATRDATEEVTKLLAQDKRFALTIDKLWEASFKSNFSKASLEAIKEAYKSKAQTLLPAVVKKARIEALRGLGKRVKEDNTKDDDRDTNTNKGVRRATPQSTSSRQSTKPGGVPQGMKTLDFLMEED